MSQAPDSSVSELPNLEVETDYHTQSKPPRFFMIGAAIAIITFIAVVFFISSLWSEHPEATLSPADPETKAPVTEVKTESPDTTDIARIPELENRLLMLAQQLNMQSDLIRQNQQRLIELDATIEQIASRTASEWEERITQLESTVADTTASVDTRLTTLEKTREPQKTAKKKKPIWAPALPFSLLSVDYWDYKPYAVLGYKGDLQHLSPGETLHKWTLISLTSEQVTFRYRNGIKRKLNVKG
ncbi:MAG: hypothetical protein JMN27_17545 [gamma proteobacterium endosymbiont of Lamellibrachia anaximandri]|nr:hypothetical protein [gamma proteobacterium endosymbiont of Lamellibrachia anaximandri]MBL3535612.1 hypothetical protein [gamma proteobacterium endosymbiont of Lamellibrachia anaximandri]